ncbi:MAG: hypothetical protein IJ188_07945 [Clostridia bacterium]|nr:hypothetical protein [Clostridia bacterium]
MKKLFALVLALSLALGCVAAFAEEATEQPASYVIYNATGEVVTELTLTANNGDETINLLEGEDYAEGLAVDGFVAFEKIYPADVEAHGYFKLAFKTEGGYEGSFDTLSIEVAPITLLSADAMTGATMITFKAVNWDCAYTIYNVTGEAVTELTLTDNVTGDVVNLLEEGATLAAGESIEASYTLAKSEEAHGRLTLKFKTEGGYEGSFETLSIEVAPISLLSADAMTGATMISFKAPEAN